MVSVDDIRNKTFQTVRFKEGYDVDEVDDFLDKVVDGMKAGRPMTAAELGAQTFHTVRFKEGYDVADVDEFLNELAHDASTRTGTPVAATTTTSATAHTAAGIPTAAPGGTPTPGTTTPGTTTPGTPMSSGIHDDPRASGWDAGASSVSGNDPFSGDEAQIPW
ncbi:cell division protein DivIVA [Bifidobacterium parmae]|uniref:Cell wall synthesis protein Wag31 n=1 Tax=Bifidobacterium parmae TaxID=361854 RepID=A0A2N5J4S2_9BIFI|nr:cell division protein DivIVA [Bifidobacterium parmae]